MQQPRCATVLMLPLWVVFSVQTLLLNAVCIGWLPNLSCESYLLLFCAEQQIAYIRAGLISCCSHMQEVISSIYLCFFLNLSCFPLRVFWRVFPNWTDLYFLLDIRMMNAGQPCFPFHFCLHACCIEFQTGIWSLLVCPDRTFVSIRENHWCAAVSVCLPPSLDSLKEECYYFLHNHPHCMYLWESSILVHGLLSRWLTQALNSVWFHMHLNMPCIFSHLLPIPEDWRLPHIPSSDKVRSYDESTICWESA